MNRALILEQSNEFTLGQTTLKSASNQKQLKQKKNGGVSRDWKDKKEEDCKVVSALNSLSPERNIDKIKEEIYL